METERTHAGLPDARPEIPPEGPAPKSKTLINISKRTFIQVTALLLGLMILAIVLTYLIPKGSFGELPDGSPDYSVYTVREDIRGISPVKGIFAGIDLCRSVIGAVIHGNLRTNNLSCQQVISRDRHTEDH